MEGMKSNELKRKVEQAGAKFLYQDATSHRYYELNGQFFGVPIHGSKEVPTGTCSKILKIIKGANK
jgi:predicted RNA binding protein YcfA (HicA-like mRNA interferase family)